MKQQVSENELSRELDSLERQKRFDDLKNNNARRELINDLRFGLGETMLKAPSKVEIIEKKKPTFKDWLIKFMKRF